MQIKHFCSLDKFPENLHNVIMNLNSRKIAYIFLAICIVIAGYFVYDTIRIMNDDGNAEEGTNGEEGTGTEAEKGEVQVKFSLYDIDEDLPYALGKKTEKELKVYLFDDETSCVDLSATKAKTESLWAIVTIPIAVLEAGKGEVKTVSIYRRDVEGTYLEVSGKPDGRNKLEIVENEDGIYEGEVDLRWSNRTLHGDFNVPFCEV